MTCENGKVEGLRGRDQFLSGLGERPITPSTHLHFNLQRLKIKKNNYMLLRTVIVMLQPDSPMFGVGGWDLCYPTFVALRALLFGNFGSPFNSGEYPPLLYRIKNTFVLQI